MKVLSIDPGAVHVGVAYWSDLHGLWGCEAAVEVSPDLAAERIFDVIENRKVDKLIIEGFWLKPGKAALQQAGSAMETVELIGLARYLCVRHPGVEFVKVANGQNAIITRLDAAGYEWASKGHGGHAKDAEAVAVRGLGLSVRQIESCVRAMDRS